MRTFSLGVNALVAALFVVAVGATSAFGTVGEVYPGFARTTESRTVEGVRFSFSVPRSGWETVRTGAPGATAASSSARAR